MYEQPTESGLPMFYSSSMVSSALVSADVQV